MPGKVALYLRLSQEDEERELESESIANQRTFLLQYAEKNGLTAAGTYIDDGYSGTNFDRPDFRRMLEDVEAGKIDTVITKDLSRLGRDYILTGHYLERYFPEHGVRYIAVNDNIDTANDEGAIRMAPFLSVMNDMYAQDISRKVRSALQAKKKEGRFVGASAPYGYKKSPEDKGKLIADENAAAVVREIFRDYLENGSLSGTAKRLTERGIPTPSSYKGQKFTQKRFAGMWNDRIVKRILTSPTYAGHLTQNRTKKISHKVEKKINLPSDQWIIIPNSHEALISQKDFDRVQEMMSIRAYHSGERGTHLLTGLAYCAGCGSPMTYVKESETRTYMVCQGYRRGGRLRLCGSHCVREDAVINFICRSLKSLAKSLIDETDIDAAVKNGRGYQQMIKQLDAARQELDANKKTALSLYKDKAAGIIKKDQYLEMNDELLSEHSRLESYIEEYGRQMVDGTVQAEMREQLKKILEFDEIDRATLVALVERVIIHEDKEIEIRFRFKQPE